MKRTLLFLLCALMSTQMFSETLFGYLFPTLAYLERTTCYYTEGDEQYRTINRLSFEDNMFEIDGNDYIEYNDFWLREDKEGRILVYSEPAKKDLVLYDFTLEVGDTLTTLNIDMVSMTVGDPILPGLKSVVVDYPIYINGELSCPIDTLIVTDVSMVMMRDSNEYKKWTFSNGMEYMEYIGNLGADFFPIIKNPWEELPACCIEERLVCASIYDRLIYQMDDAEMQRLNAECQCSSWASKWCDTWNVLEFNGMAFEQTAQTWQYKLAYDTIIDGKEYQAVTRHWTAYDESAAEYVAAVRFTENKKAFIYYDNAEYLLYDFGYHEIGDTLEVFSGINNYMHFKTYKCVITDNYSTADGIAEDTYVMDIIDPIIGNTIPAAMIWEEFVGSYSGFLHGGLLVPGNSNYQLLCAYKDNVLAYSVDNDAFTDNDTFIEYGCEYNAEQKPKDLFPTLWGLQRTEVEFHTDGASAPSLVSFNEYTPTLVNGKWYLYDGRNYLREENNQVLLYAPDMEIYEDVVLYDWTLEIGDTLPFTIRPFDDDKMRGAVFRVTDVSTITLLDGKEYKKWTLACGIEYIEGIGAINGEGFGNYFCIQHTAHPATYIGTHLVCVSKNNKLLYQMDDAEMERLGAECLCEVETSYKSQWCDTWNVLNLGYWTNSWTTKEDFETWKYCLAHDTIIGNYTYTAVTRQTTKVPEGVYPFIAPAPEYVAAVRFTDDSKVYIHYDNTEYLLYDFNVQPGDELTVFAGINHYHSHKTNTCRIHEVERTPGIEYSTKISLMVIADFTGDIRPTCAGETKWIEGVGDLCGFITGADCGLSDDQSALLCAYKEGNQEYSTELEEYAEYGCEYNTASGEYTSTLAGLQRTVYDEFCGEAEIGAVYTGKQTFDKIFFENDKPYILCNDYLLHEEDNKILIYSQLLNKDLVLYDFTLEVGDSLPALYIDYHARNARHAMDWMPYNSDVVDYNKDFDGTIYPADTFVVTDISNVTLLDGKEYKKWTFDNGMEYVEGIGMYGGRRNGDFFGLIREVVVPCHIGTHLVCASRNNKLLYQMDAAEMERLGAECLCDYDRGPRKDNAKDGQIGGRPTPTQWNQLELDLREMDNGTTILRAETFSYTLENDSVVANDKIFYQLARQSTKDTATTKSFVGALHFGKDEDNRVYFLRDGVEYVLYDFTAEPGDTVEIFAGINNYPQDTTYTHVVTGKDTLENGACRMLLEVVFPEETTTAENAEKVWLAGLGSVDGIVHNAAKRTSNAHAAPARSANSETQTSVMLCAWREDSCLYMTNHPDYDAFGCVYNQDLTAVESPTSSSSYQKVLRGGQLLIMHNGKTYTVMGIEMK